MKLKKQVFSGFMSVVMLANFCTVMPISAFANDDEVQENSSDNGHRYQLFDTSMSWSEAKAYCESLGGHLATITSAEEQAKIEELLTIGTRNSYWLGASDPNYDGNWQWITNEGFSYNNWANQQPDRYLKSENSLMIYREANPLNTDSGFGQWNDLSPDGTCEDDTFFGLDNFGFICEWEAEESPVEVISTMKDYALFSASQTENLSFYGWKSNISGNIYSGASFN